MRKGPPALSRGGFLRFRRVPLRGAATGPENQGDGVDLSGVRLLHPPPSIFVNGEVTETGKVPGCYPEAGRQERGCAGSIPALSARSIWYSHGSAIPAGSPSPFIEDRGSPYV